VKGGEAQERKEIFRLSPNPARAGGRLFQWAGNYD